MTTVFFATNRRADGTGFSASIVPEDAMQITYATAEVTGTDLNAEDSGTITAIQNQTGGNFSDAVRAQIIAPGRNLLVFIHGADNTFEDAIKRAAFNRDWFAATGNAATNTTVIAFTWPSDGNAFKSPNNPLDAYRADQAQAAKSGFHIESFLKNMVQLRAEFRAAHPTGRMFLLAHSMGNYA